jgi:hypothetical protein
MTNCEEIRDHLEGCEDCRLHVAVEARLRTQPVLEPPAGLADRVLKALPRAVPVRRELARLAAAAAVLVALGSGLFLSGLDRDERVVSVKEKTARSVAAAWSTLSAWRTAP